MYEFVHMNASAPGGQERVRVSGTGITDGCEPLDMSAWNSTLVLRKRDMRSYTEPLLQSCDLIFETESCSVAQVGLDLTAILLPQPLKVLNYRCEPLCLSGDCEP